MTGIDLLLVLAAYLAGSLPMGLWIGRAKGVDLRAVGSRNIGATNAGRILGRKFFFLVFALDFAKAFAPALLAPRCATGSLDRELLALIVGVAAIVGHVFPLFLRFKGGKGVATAAGVFFAVAPAPAAIALCAFLLVFLATKIVSLSSIVSALVLPASCIALDRAGVVAVGRPATIAASLVALLIVVRHRANVGRLLRGEEPRFGAKK